MDGDVCLVTGREVAYQGFCHGYHAACPAWRSGVGVLKRAVRSPWAQAAILAVGVAVSGLSWLIR